MNSKQVSTILTYIELNRKSFPQIKIVPWKIWMPIFELYHVHKVEGQEIYSRIYRFDDSQGMQ